ncbi:MAG: ubiquinone/menaquinone biosynthesis methyltransferase [bacterium]|nr:ubiquinone/menaquinone biosynthesis methyltransferase [bacterium]
MADSPRSIDTRTSEEAPAELSTKRVKRIFSEISGKYERFNAISSLGTYKIWLASLVNSLDIEPTDTVLDIAGGTGDVSFAIAKIKKPAYILCTDLVEEMLDVARAHHASGKGAGVAMEFAVADAQDLPIADNSFDFVTVAYGIRNMPQRQKALSEAFRVLKPRGTFACLEFSTPQNSAWNAIYTIYRKKVLPFIGERLTGHGDDFAYLSDSIASFPDQLAFAEMIEAAGFADVRWKNHSGGIAAIHIAHKPQ